jgi:hypothetical protein
MVLSPTVNISQAKPKYAVIFTWGEKGYGVGRTRKGYGMGLGERGKDMGVGERGKDMGLGEVS